MQKITPFLWFDGTAEEAANFYVSLFKNAKIVSGSAMSTTFEIDGRQYIAFNGGPMFKFTEAISFQINCDTQAEIADAPGETRFGLDAVAFLVGFQLFLQCAGRNA